MNDVANDPLAGLNEAKTSWIKWGKPGDWVRGTLTNVREIQNNFPGKEGEKVKIYEFMAAGGSFHHFQKVAGVTQVEETATILEPGSLWNIGGKAGIDSQMRNVKIGQVFGMRYSEDKPNKNPSFSPTKVIKVLIGEMDPTYQGETAGDMSHFN